jgi:tetratricopeptide (TPR) repeat protein
MKNVKLHLITLIALFAFIGHSYGQIELPAPSPTATFTQKVGLTDVTINYSRPSMKGRTIFGNLVAYGKLWRTGANSATKLTFSDDVKIAGKDLAAGTYALFTIPGENEWTIIFNKNINQGGTGNYKESEDALRVNIKSMKIPGTVETFYISLEDLKPNSALIEILWESTIVQIPLEVSIDERIMASIDDAMKIGPNVYQQAANYYHQSGKDLDQALAWMNKALKIHEAEGNKVFWIYRQKSLLQADMKKYKDAIATAEISLKMATDAKNDDYIKMNTESIAVWSKK